MNKKTKLGLNALAVWGMLGVQSSYAQDGLRPLAADRPDATESPQTVDKGHWQVETTLVGFAQDRASGETVRSYEAFSTNLKYGVTDSVDLHLVVSPYVYEEVSALGVTHSRSSHGDFELRSKINLWGNAGGENALALLPYVKIPSGALSNDKTEGGIIVTYASDLGGFGVGLQAQADYLYDESKDEMGWSGSHTAVLGFDVGSQVGGYVEYIGERDLAAEYVPYASFGLTYQPDANRQWDVGSKVALDKQGQDFEVFFGVTQRY
ncbi:transporter [Thiomicrorhabdus cannonii]|uniref:transporter n=1 Tax=Thiomicrorhabdus cannonii TaxID=2748011 RepID=UPI0015BBF1A3|nr:transporter [Thiomicrorhabdus cannonii]